MKYCQKCGGQLKDEASFCNHCGCAVQPLVGQVYQQAPNAASTKFCQKCGSEIFVDAIACPNCGCACNDTGYSQQSYTYQQPVNSVPQTNAEIYKRNDQ